ncbi:MAG: DUF6468 domain-containing protein [Caulobacteraceae bacterium]
MSPVSLGLDLLLVILLISALAVGIRLNQRLSALRAGHQGFAKAVGELDAAAARAEAGLAHLRAVADETHDQLLTRIETARGLIAKLDSAAAVAARATERPERSEPAPAPASSRPLRFAPAPEPVAERRPPPTPFVRGRSSAEDIREALVPRRGVADDDLFEDGPRRTGGRR